MLRKYMAQKNHGYTLFEIMIVTTIIVILATAALIALNPLGQIFKGFDARRRADLNKIKIAFEAYYEDKGCYPPASILSHCGSKDLAPYLPIIPCDPNDNTPYKVKVIPANSTCPQQYAIYASLFSFFSRLANTVQGCPKTFAVYSENMSFSDLAAGCTGSKTCVNKYGCKNGICALVAVDVVSPCSPWSCSTDCGLNARIGQSCANTDENGYYTNECIDF